MTPDEGDTAREGMYADWEWNSLLKCWEHHVPYRIYPHDDGTFSTSSSEVWHSGNFKTFDEAEIDVFGISQEQASSDLPCGECHLQPGEVCDICGRRASNETPEEAAHQWQPIETAPEDRTILVYCPPAHNLQKLHSLCRWHPDAGFCVDELRDPTHWMELTAPAAIRASNETPCGECHLQPGEVCDICGRRDPNVPETDNG